MNIDMVQPGSTINSVPLAPPVAVNYLIKVSLDLLKKSRIPRELLIPCASNVTSMRQRLQCVP